MYNLIKAALASLLTIALINNSKATSMVNFTQILIECKIHSSSSIGFARVSMQSTTAAQRRQVCFDKFNPNGTAPAGEKYTVKVKDIELHTNGTPIDNPGISSDDLNNDDCYSGQEVGLD